MQDKKLTAEDIAIPETVEVAIMQWWNSIPNAFRVSDRAPHYLDCATEAVKVALLSLATNPVVPPEDVVDSLTPIDKGFIKRSIRNDVACACTEWQRRMFLKRVPEVPEEIKAYLWDIPANGWEERQNAKLHNEQVMQIFALGKEARDGNKL